MEQLRGSFLKWLQVVDRSSNHTGEFVGALSVKLKTRVAIKYNTILLVERNANQRPTAALSDLVGIGK